MRKIRINKYILLASIICITFSLSLWAERGLNADFVKAARRAKPSVVYIAVYSLQTTGKRQSVVKSAYGSGTIISDDGYVVTNYHVVKEGTYCQVTLANGQKCDVVPLSQETYFLADRETDIAVIKIKKNDNSSFVPIHFGNSSELAEGEWVMAIGNPYGLRHSITAGIVSYKGRQDVGFADIEDFIQTDVPINPGNSGGPLINLKGEMVGINTAIRTVSGGYQGISFSIPSYMVTKVFRELLQHGHVRRGWLGVFVQGEPHVARIDGVEIVSVLKNSPAAHAGIRKGDVIVRVDNNSVHTKGALLRIVKNKQVHSIISITVNRSGDIRSFRFKLREKRSYQKLSKVLKKMFDLYGIEVDLNSGSDALVISFVSPLQMHCHSNMLNEGDIIVALNGRKVTSLEQFARVFRQSRYKVDSMKILRNHVVYMVDFRNIE